MLHDSAPPVSLLHQGAYLVASVYAALDDTQMARFRHDLAEAIGHHRASGVVIDLAALDVLDSFGSRNIRDTAEIARLRGAATVIVGIQPDVAFAMVNLGIGSAAIPTALDLEEGLDLLDHHTHPTAGRRTP
jgi:rsbT antagonist protein RsbS